MQQTNNRYNKEYFSTISQIGQNALIESKVLKQANIIWVKQYQIWT